VRFAGGPRMVQRRARNGSCAAIARLAAFDPACYGVVSSDGLRGAVDREPFVGGSGAQPPPAMLHCDPRCSSCNYAAIELHSLLFTVTVTLPRAHPSPSPPHPPRPNRSPSPCNAGRVGRWCVCVCVCVCVGGGQLSKQSKQTGIEARRRDRAVTAT
jgi:hypothetical protein